MRYKITKIQQINSKLFVLKCPFCGAYVASGATPHSLPNYSYCTCPDEFDVYNDDDGNFIIEHLMYPRFRGVVSNDIQSSIDEIELLDDCMNRTMINSSLAEAHSFINKYNTL